MKKGAETLPFYFLLLCGGHLSFSLNHFQNMERLRVAEG